MNLFWLGSSTVNIIGLIFEFIGVFLLASEMTGLLEIVESKNSKLKEKINSIESGTLDKTLNTSFIIVILKRLFGLKISFKEILNLIGLMFFLSISSKLLYVLRLANKIATKRGIGWTGLIFLFIGRLLEFNNRV